jgi:serine/threonine protein kinase
LNDAWVQVTASEHPWEREALAYLKEHLPDHEPYRVWANFEFLVDGTVSEVDALVIARKGVFLVEIKSWPGRLAGDAGTWQWTPPDAVEPRLRDNPYILANRKAKRLKGLLARQRALRGKRVPYIAPLVFLSDPALQVSLGAEARLGVTVRDPEEGPSQGGLAGILSTLTSLSAEERERLGDRAIDRPTSKLIAAALEQAGVRPSQKRRRVGDLELRALLDEGVGYQDHLGVHPRFPSVEHRVRIYGMADLATDEQRAQLSRAARREYELLQAVSHPGIVRVQGFVEHELGPALVFERDRSEVRLDQFLQRHHASLTLYDRFNLVRDLAEAVAHAHAQRLFHRALSPRSVLVVPEPSSTKRFSIINWQTGSREDASDSALTMQGTQHPEQLVDAGTTPYLAPEAITQPNADPELLDVFSLGAIAFHVFCGQPPAENLAGLVTTLQRDGALEVSSVLDGAGQYLAELVRESTRGDATRRYSMRDFLDGLALIEEEITAPEPVEETLPEDAGPGDELGGYTVIRRLGRGSTAIAFHVSSPSTQQVVLKVANDPERNDRLRDEGDVLAKLRHPAIVAIHGDPIDVAGRTGIVLGFAAHGTLADQLRRQGRLGLENLQNWGEDLLSALAYLEQEGIPHRDIKPANLGIAEVGRSKKRRLVLLDFSLARAGAAAIEAGTRQYLDPFLGQDGRTRWDVAADRFSAAIVLHEMATGTTPFCSAPGVDPRMVSDEVTIEADALPRDVARPLADFLARALRRGASERFHTAEDMLRSWRAIFARLDSEHVDEEAAVDVASLRAAARPETSIDAIGLSARALDAVERLGVLTAGDLLRVGPIELNRLRGVGRDTRTELVEARRDLRARLGPTSAPTTTVDEDAPDVQGLDALVAQLVPRQTRRNESQVAGLRRLLGLDALDGVESLWPTQTDVAASMEVTRARVQQIATAGRERWRRLPAVTRLRDELLAALKQLGGVAVVEDLERVVAGERGADDEAKLPVLARAAVRAAIEAELTRDEPRLTRRRSGGRVLVASASSDDRARQRAIDYALRLGEAADAIAALDTLLPSGQVRTALRAVTPPLGFEPLSPERLVTLAASVSTQAAPSAKLELYPRGMDAERALRLGRGALLGADALSIDELRRRIAARFPAAVSLPERPALDRVLRDAGIELRWNTERELFLAPDRAPVTDLTSYASPFTRLATAAHTHLPAPADPLVVEARDFEARLEHARRDGGLLVLMASPSRVEDAARELRRLDVTSLDLDALLLHELRAVADEVGAAWPVVVAADAAARGDGDWSRLTTLVARVIPRVEAALAETEGTVLLRHLGLLARYGQLGLIERMREHLRGGGALRGLWLLIGADTQRTRPLVDGEPIPVLTANESLRIPEPWLRNVHRSAPTEGRAA